MRHVKIISGAYSGQTGLQRDDGKVQLDGPKDVWRLGKDAPKMYPMCYNWHDINGEVEEIP